MWHGEKLLRSSGSSLDSLDPNVAVWPITSDSKKTLGPTCVRSSSSPGARWALNVAECEYQKRAGGWMMMMMMTHIKNWGLMHESTWTVYSKLTFFQASAGPSQPFQTRVSPIATSLDDCKVEWSCQSYEDPIQHPQPPAWRSACHALSKKGDMYL